MKRLSDYTTDLRTELFSECGAFFALNVEQLKKHKKQNVKYVLLADSLICDKRYKQKLINGLSEIQARSIKKDIKENSVKDIIWRELANYESQITMDITDTVEALKPYNITKERILQEWKEYFQSCKDNDYF